MRPNQVIFILSGIIILSLLFSGAVAQGNQPPPTQPAAQARTKSTGKLSSRLNILAQSPALRLASAADQARALDLPEQGPGSLLRDANGRLLAYIRMTDLSETQLEALRAFGVQVVHVAQPYEIVTAFIDPADANAVEGLAAVQSIREVLAPMVGDGSASGAKRLSSTGANTPLASCPQGVAVSEGDVQLNAAAARSTFGINGAGVNVAMLSDSYDQAPTTATRALADVQSGDLPGIGNPCGFPTPVSVVTPSLDSSNTDEGRGMLQIVHDLAPGASLSFASAVNGIYAYGDSIRKLRQLGADILGDDIFYFDDPFFQDGPVSVAIGDVVGSGALYFSLAGNQNYILGGNNISSYEAPSFRPTNCPAGLPVDSGPDCHNFDPTGGVSNSSGITLLNGGVLSLEFQWNEPWFGVGDDLDIYLLNDANIVVAQSIDNNVLTQVPSEAFYWFKNTTGYTQHYRIVVNRYSGSGTPRLKYVFLQYTYYSHRIQSIQYSTSNGGDIVGPTLYGHSGNPFGLSVAAVPYSNASIPEEFTSRGPATHYFGPVVNALPASAIAPVIIRQPDFGATDGVCTTFFYQYVSPTCWRFYGTSAATPHAAAVAALLKHKANQLHLSLSAPWTKFLLQTTATPMSGGSVDSVGAGLLNALAAVKKLRDSRNTFLPVIFR